MSASRKSCLLKAFVPFGGANIGKIIGFVCLRGSFFTYPLKI